MSLGKQILRGIFGPLSANDNEVPRFDGTTGKLIQAGTGVYVDDAGQLSVGAGSNPDAKLHLSDSVANDENGPKLRVERIAPEGTVLFDLFADQFQNVVLRGDSAAGSSLQLRNFVGHIEIAAKAANKDLRFETASGRAMTISGADNNVGIGTDSPETKLHVKGVIHVADPALTRYFIEVFSSGGVGFIDSYDSTGNDYQDLVVRADDFIFKGEGTERFRITDLGNVGINETDPQEKLAVAGNIVIPKTSGIGIKVDNTIPTFGWRDLKGKVTQRNTGPSKPTHATYRDTLAQFQFAAGKEEYFTYHIDHDHEPDSDIFLHVHWSHTSAQVNGGSLLIEYEMSYAKGFNQGAFPASVSSTFLGTASITQYQHIISEIQVSAAAPNAASEIDSNDLEPDGVIETRVKILENNITVSGGGVPDPFIHEADIHYQSTGMGTKQREPDFYT